MCAESSRSSPATSSGETSGSTTSASPAPNMVARLHGARSVRRARRRAKACAKSRRACAAQRTTPFAAIELIAFVTAVVGSLRRRAAPPVPAWAFGLLPPLGFAVQEFLERWLSGALFPWWMVLQPTFRIGLLLQLPFGLAAYLVARLLLRAADEVGRALGRQPRCPQVGLSPAWAVSPSWVPRLSVIGSHAGRGPPAAAAAILSCAV